MKLRSLYNLILLGCSFLLLQACMDEQDFNQADELQVVPTLEASVLYLEAPEALINALPPATYYSEIFNFDAFSEEFVAENVLEGVITYEVENTTSKRLRLTTEFLDANEQVLDTESFNIPPAPTAKLRREITYGDGTGRPLDIIRNTSSIRVSAENLSDNSSVSGIPEPKIIFRSSAKFTLELR